MAEISEKELKEYQELKKSRTKQYKRQNKHIKENYYRVSVTLPKDYKERLKAAGVGSVNGFINELVTAELKKMEDIKDVPFA